MNKLYYDGTVDFNVKVNTKFVRYGMVLFYILLLAAGITTLFYTKNQLPNAAILGAVTIAASFSGFALLIYKTNPRITLLSISTAMLMRPAALLSKMFYGVDFPVVGNLVGVLLYTATWVFFYVCWVTFMEPYATYRIRMQRLLAEEYQSLESKVSNPE